MSTARKSPARKPSGRSAAPPRIHRTTTARRPAPRRGAPGRSAGERAARERPAPGRRPRPTRRSTADWGRCLWAVVVAVVIAAILFEFTMVWTLGVGFYMLALGEFTGLWLLVGGYAMACTPAAFGLLIATGRFWRSLTHSLWIGLLYGALGFTFLDVVLGVL